MNVKRQVCIQIRIARRGKGYEVICFEGKIEVMKDVSPSEGILKVRCKLPVSTYLRVSCMGIGDFLFCFLPECSDYRGIDFYTPQSFPAYSSSTLIWTRWY